MKQEEKNNNSAQDNVIRGRSREMTGFSKGKKKQMKMCKNSGQISENGREQRRRYRMSAGKNGIMSLTISIALLFLEIF
jgi:hypothetical protein